MDLAAQVGAGEVVAGEDGAYGAAEFFEGGVGGVLGAAASEAAQDLFGLGGARRRAVAYLTIWSYCWAMRSQWMGRVIEPPRAGQP